MTRESSDRYWLRVMLPAVTIPLCALVLWFLGAGLARAQDALAEHDKALARHDTLLKVVDERWKRIEERLTSLDDNVDELRETVLKWGPSAQERDR